jgi:hypothetical protein
VAPEDPAVTERLDALQRLGSLDPEVAFDELAVREPELLTVRNKVASLPVKSWPRTVEEMREDRGSTSMIFEDLRPLVGRERADHDPILGTVTAYGICRGFLHRLRCSGAPPKFDRPAG